MPSGRATTLGDLPAKIRALLATARRGVMTTLEPDGSPHSVPVVFAVIGDTIVSPIDHKPKTGAVLRRVKNLARDDRITLLVDDYDEDWTRLAWLMVRGTAIVDEGASDEIMRVVNSRYPQYETDERHDALIRITPARYVWWSWT